MAKKTKGKSGSPAGRTRSLVTQAEYDVSLPKELLDRAKRDLRKEKYITPYRLSQKYNVTLSTARKIINALVEEGLIVKFGGTRRTPIYVPKDKAPERQFNLI